MYGRTPGIVIETGPSLEFGLGSFSVMGWAKVRTGSRSDRSPDSVALTYRLAVITSGSASGIIRDYSSGVVWR